MRDYSVAINRGRPKPVASLSDEEIRISLRCLSIGRYRNGMTQCTDDDLIERLKIEIVARQIANHS